VGEQCFCDQCLLLGCLQDAVFGLAEGVGVEIEVYICAVITIYGIKNCGTMQKAMKWLDVNGIPYLFHDYKESGIDKETLEVWLRHFPTDKLINTRGTTYRTLSDTDKAGITSKNKAIRLMLGNTSLIKRPVWDLGGGVFFLGWDEAELKKLLG